MRNKITAILAEHQVILNKTSEVILWLLVLCIPLAAITSIREILTFCALFLVLCLLAAHARRFYKDRVWLMWALLLTVALISLSFSADIDYSLTSIRRELGKGLIMFFIGLHILASPAALQRLWRILLAGLAAMSMVAVIASIPHLRDSGWQLGFNPGYRASSLSMGYGHFAAYLSIAIPYLLVAPRAFAFSKKSAWLLWGGALVLAILAAYFTFSRILWFCLPLSILLYFWLMLKRRLLMGIIGCVVLAAIALVLVSSPKHSHGEKWKNLLENPTKVGGTAGDLILLWKYSFEHMREHPFVGVGFGKNNFAHAHPDFIKSTHPLLQHTHNIFVDYFIQMGIQGLVVLLLFLLLLLKSLWPHAPPAAGDVPACFRLATLIMIASYFLRNQVDQYFIDDPALLFWLLCGLALASRLIKPFSKKELSS